MSERVGPDDGDRTPGLGTPAVSAASTLQPSASTDQLEPPAPAPEDPDGSPSASRRRRALPWVLLAIGGAALLVAGIVVALVVIPAFVGGSADPTATVREFDRAYRDADCELYQATTTESFRESARGVDASGAFDCATWEEFAAGYTVGGDYQYRLEVISSAMDGDSAGVLTHEEDLGTGEEFDYRYTLVEGVDGRWLIASIRTTDPGSE